MKGRKGDAEERPQNFWTVEEQTEALKQNDADDLPGQSRALLQSCRIAFDRSKKSERFLRGPPSPSFFM